MSVFSLRFLPVKLSKTLLTTQVQLTASAHVAITGCASPQLNTGSKSGALFLLGVLRVGVWSYPLCKTTARSLLCTRKQGRFKELSVRNLQHVRSLQSDRLDVGIIMFSASQKALGCLCPSATPTLEDLII